ncbi:MAG: acyl carrier protein [Pseudonocardiales bacterium]|nr:acyl carrier protein [Pseudonocardiales bacterium]
MMDNAEILAGLNEIIKEATAGMVQNVTAEKSFAEDLDIDSLTIVEIAVLAEEKFGVKIPEGELANFKTVEDMVNYVSANSK